MTRIHDDSIVQPRDDVFPAAPGASHDHPTPRSVALLADALHPGVLMHAIAPGETIHTTSPGVSVDGTEVRTRLVDGLLAHTPLAAALASGIAWQDAVAALPEGALGPNLMHHEDYTGKRSWTAESYAEEGARPRREWSDTPEAALVGLTARLKGHD